MTLLELANRVEAATGRDRELDGEIHGAMGDDQRRRKLAELGVFGPSYTASLDAAMTLVPEPRSFVISHCGNTVAHVQLIGGDPCAEEPEFTGRAATPALALCAAALRARANVSEQEDVA